MAQSKLELAVGTGQWDAGLRKAQQALNNFTQAQGGLQQALNKDNSNIQKFVQMMGKITSTATTAKGQMADYKRSIEQLSGAYNQMSAAQKASIGKDYLNTIDALKQKFRDAQTQANELNKSLNDSSTVFNGALSSLASKLGVNSELMGVLTTGTMGYTAAITAGAGAVAYATREWAAFNDELAKQKQITGVTTRLTGGDADALTAAARSMSKVYGTDFREVINAANVLINQFGASGEEAIQLLRDGMQGMIQGDGPKLLNMIQQYAPAFQSAGVSASQLVAVIQNSEGGLFTDQNMQAIIMGLDKIRNMTNGTAEALRAVGIDADGMKEKMRNGSMTVFEALQEVGRAIDNNKGKTEEVGAVMREVFGRQARTAGDNLGRAISELNTNIDETKTQTGEVGESLKELNLKTEEFERKLMDVFGMNGWDTMNNEIKTGLLVSLTETLGRLEDIFHMLNGIAGLDMNVSGVVKFFTDLTTFAYEAMNPIIGLLDLLGQLNKLMGGGGNSGGNGDKLSPEMQRVYQLAEQGFSGYSTGDVVVTGNRPRKTPRTPKGGRGGSVVEQTEEQLNTKKIQEYSREFENASAERQQWILKEIEVLKKRNEEIKYYQDYAQGKIRPTGSDVASGQGIGLGTVNSGVSELLNKPIDASNILTPLQQMQAELQKIIELQQLAWSPEQFAAYQEQIDDIKNKINKFTGKLPTEGKETSKSFNAAASSIQSVGSAMQQLKDPTAKVMGIVAQAIASIALGFAQATTAEAGKGIWAWLAAIAGGTATMITTIEAIHNATGYAEGGIIKGNSYSGDKIGGLVDGNQFVGLNAGELVLNASQQSNLAQNLQGSGGGGVHVAGILRGEDIVLVADRWGRRTGKGELLFGKNL